MKNITVSLSLALCLCVFDPSVACRGINAGKGCISAFLTLPSCCASSQEPESEDTEVEYGFKLYELIKKLFS